MPGPVTLGGGAASDPDRGDTLSYSLAGDGAAKFSVDTDGTVSYAGGGEDYESGPGSYELTATVTDAGGLSAAVTLTVTVTDANEAPAFAEPGYAFDLAENVPGPFSLGGVSASDPDGGDMLAYSLAGDGAAKFSVDPDGTVSYTGGGEDFESGPGSYEFTATVIDAAGLSAAVPLTVTVTDTNEAPAFAEPGYAFDLAENVAGPFSLGGVSASDPDGGDALAYSLSGDAAQQFSVDPDGTVSYTGGGEDFESGPGSYEFTATATDAGGLPAAVPLTVTVTDANEAPAFAEPGYAFDLAENVPGPFTLGGVSASDPDEGDMLAYSLSGDGAAQFSADPDGTVSYTGGGEDFESGPGSYEFTASATDARGLSASVPLTVTVTDANEAPEAAGSIPPKVLEAYGASAVDDLSGFFQDADGDALAYAAVSSLAEVAAADVSGSQLTVRPLAIGITTVTVTASDPDGLSAPQSLTVTVEPSQPDRARSVKLSLAAFGRTIGTETVEAIAGRLGTVADGGDGGGAPGGSHLRVGGESLQCGVSSGGESCGWRTLVGDASQLLGMRSLHSALSNGREGFMNMLLPGGWPKSFGDLGTDSLGAMFGGFADVGGSGMSARKEFGVQGALGAQGTFGGQSAAGARNQPGTQSADHGRAAPGELPGLSGLKGLVAMPSPGSLRGSPVSREALLSETSFQFSGGGSQDQEGSAGGFTLWGRAGAGGFEGSPEDGFTMSGRTRSAYLGGDYRFSAGALAGVALSRTSGSIDFSSDVNGDGTLEPRMLGVHPYVQWSPAAGLDIWGVAGAGRGSADLAETRGGTFATDLSMIMGAMGAMGARRAVTGGFALKADAFSVRITSDEAASLAGVTANARRVRLAPEISGVRGSGGSSFRTSLEVGARLDGGDAETGMGAEAAGTLGYDHAGAGISLEARGRTLLVHEDEDFGEWGASVSFRFRPAGDGGDEGLSLSVEPEWGGAATGANALWRSGPALAPATGGMRHAGIRHGGMRDGGAAAAGWAPNRLNAEVGYVLPIAGRGRFEPFGRWTRDDGNGYRLNAGIRLSILDAQGGEGRNPLFMIDLSGEQRADGLLPAARRLALQGRIAFD